MLTLSQAQLLHKIILSYQNNSTIRETQHDLVNNQHDGQLGNNKEQKVNLIPLFHTHPLKTRTCQLLHTGLMKFMSSEEQSLKSEVKSITMKSILRTKQKQT